MIISRITTKKITENIIKSMTRKPKFDIINFYKNSNEGMTGGKRTEMTSDVQKYSNGRYNIHASYLV